jgi:hypothetical protein
MLWQKNYTTCTMHAVSLSNLMDFSFREKFREIFAKRNFAKIIPFSHDFRIIAIKNTFSSQPYAGAVPVPE